MKDQERCNGWWLVPLVWLLLVSPLVAGTMWLRRHGHFAPIFELAMTELRVRDVGTAQTPLLGLPGRLGPAGCHPGPLSFYLLAPVYRLLGGSYWALRVSTAAFNALAIAGALILARRTAGAAGVIGAGIAIGILELGFGLMILTEPWNPHLPVLWFATFLLAVWAVTAGSARTLPFALATGSLCAQTHIPYAAMCGGLGFLAFTWVLAQTFRAHDASVRRVHLRACALASGVVLVAWAPPLVDQIIHRPGNLAALYRFFRHAPEATIGLRGAVPLILTHLDAWYIVAGSFGKPSVLSIAVQAEQPSVARGAVFLASWVLAALIGLKVGGKALRALHAVALCAVVVAWVSFSRILGVPWTYLTFSAWSVGILLFAATVSTAGLVFARALSGRVPERHARICAEVAGLAVIGACALRLGSRPDEASTSAPGPSIQLAALAPAVSDALLANVGAARGFQGRYLVTWKDALYLGAQGFGLVNELDRRGFHAGLTTNFATLITERRVFAASEPTARVYLATGGWIREVRRLPGAVRIAYSDPRTDAERKEFASLREAVIRELKSLGHTKAVKDFDRDIGGATAPGVSLYLALEVMRMAELGV
ncbi:MAG TPA: hypothetical protein VF395_09070, partial [Polyangiaceae bacterium]